MTEPSEQRQARKEHERRRICKRAFREHEIAGLMSQISFYAASTTVFLALKLPDPPQTWKKGAFQNFSQGEDSV